MTNTIHKPKFAINQIWLDHNSNTQIICRISTDEQDCYPIKVLNGGAYTIEGKCDYGFYKSTDGQGLVSYLGEYTPKNQKALRHADGTYFKVGQEWIIQESGWSEKIDLGTVKITKINKNDFYPITAKDKKFHTDSYYGGHCYPDVTVGRYNAEGLHEGCEEYGNFNLIRLYESRLY